MLFPEHPQAASKVFVKASHLDKIAAEDRADFSLEKSASLETTCRVRNFALKELLQKLISFLKNLWATGSHICNHLGFFTAFETCASRDETSENDILHQTRKLVFVSTNGRGDKHAECAERKKKPGSSCE